MIFLQPSLEQFAAQLSDHAPKLAAQPGIRKKREREKNAPNACGSVRRPPLPQRSTRSAVKLSQRFPEESAYRPAEAVVVGRRSDAPVKGAADPADTASRHGQRTDRNTGILPPYQLEDLDRLSGLERLEPAFLQVDHQTWHPEDQEGSSSQILQDPSCRAEMEMDSPSTRDHEFVANGSELGQNLLVTCSSHLDDQNTVPFDEPYVNPVIDENDQASTSSTSACSSCSNLSSYPSNPSTTLNMPSNSPPETVCFVRTLPSDHQTLNLSPDRRRTRAIRTRSSITKRQRITFLIVRMFAVATLVTSLTLASFAVIETASQDGILSRRARNTADGVVNPANKDDLDNLYRQLDDTTTCNRTLDTPLLRQLLNSTIQNMQIQKPVLQWLANVAPRYPYLLEMKNTPLNTTVTKTPLIRPVPGSHGPVHVLHLDCAPSPRWVPVSVYGTATTETFVEMRLPELELNACPFSQCYQSKCSWTSHGDLKVYAKPCCDAESRFCRADWTAMLNLFYILSILFALGSLAMILVVVRERHRQQQEARGWALMELFFVGAAILYTIPLIDWSGTRAHGCAIAIWLREIGFTLFYGSVVLKIYRNLQEYRVRKAHHVIVREQDLLKYLAGFMVITLTGLVAWTLGVQHSTELWNSQWPQCPFESWSWMWTLFELLFLLYGVRLCYKARSSNWVERYQFTAAVCLEILVNMAVQIARYFMRDTGSHDFLFVTAIIKLHLTVSVNIAAIITPKFIVNSETNRRSLSMSGTGNSSRAHPSLAKLRDNLINGTIDFAEIPIIDMNPEDIRAELKRVYTQLRMYKLKNLYQDNPHISKRKGGKKYPPS
ncbi:unnamed protein product [Bursaphelenchus xylophilus]|uniref:(pine wood nematode) hypothetical protein n=1 Tax=Bursaphelenchus xylophilus TaxID=6326 RepID=A0A7I8XL88_BURXY|nr:unnamed protein product [Bursaphelenchus xylophilus]CAG9086545.1 unnamed protein product [Bursaphelenchus xylophilus]